MKNEKLKVKVLYFHDCPRRGFNLLLLFGFSSPIVRWNINRPTEGDKLSTAQTISDGKVVNIYLTSNQTNRGELE